MVKQLRGLKQLIRRLFRLANTPEAPRDSQQEWSIGIYTGKSPFHFEAPEDIDNPVLTPKDILDTATTFVADPFMVRENGRWHMFFEACSQQRRKGEIALATSQDGMRWSYQQIVLVEPFHLSYPYVFKWRNDYYMIPESYESSSIRLYHAVHFPTQWSFVRSLVQGDEFVDSSIFRLDDKWWLLTSVGNPPIRADNLCLYFASELMGSWQEHKQSPVVRGNPHIARPAGTVLLFNGNMVRYAQDCYPVYGAQVRAFEITELTTASYRERLVGNRAVISGSGSGWNSSGMHHVDPHVLEDGRWIACVDGWRSIGQAGGDPTAGIQE